MTSSIRLKRLSKLALQTASQVVLYELADPRLELVTLTRVKLSPDLSHATIFWSAMGDDAHRNKVAHALAASTGPVQRAIARTFETRRTPRVKFLFDESIEGAIRVGHLLDDLRREREEHETHETGDGAGSDGESLDDGDAGDTDAGDTESGGEGAAPG